MRLLKKNKRERKDIIMSEKITLDCSGKKIELDVKELDKEQLMDDKQKQHEEQMAREGNLPEIKTIFSIENQLFIITYINYGKNRISCEWYNDKSGPFTGPPEVESTCNIHGKIYKVIHTNESKRRINIEPISN